MKKFTIGMILVISIFLGIHQNVSAEKLYPIDYEFTITFNQPVELEVFREFVKVLDEFKKESSYIITYGNKENIVKVSPEKKWAHDTNYSIILNAGMPNQVQTQVLKKRTTFDFTTEKEPHDDHKKDLAPVSNRFIEYANKNLVHSSHAEADYYFSNVLNESLINQYNDFFEKSVLPYTTSLFPLVKEHNENPTFVLLGNENESSTIEFAKIFYSRDSIPYGWFTPLDNITIMTQSNYAPPYKEVNTILFPHEYFHWVDENVYGSSIPIWLNEGIAYNFSWALYYKTNNFMKSPFYEAYKNAVIENENLDITDGRIYMAVTAYIQGIYGQDKLENLLIRSANEKFDSVFIDIYGKSVEQMVKEAKNYIINGG